MVNYIKYFIFCMMFIHCGDRWDSPEYRISQLEEKVKTLERKRSVTLLKDAAQLTLHVILISGILYFIYQSYLKKVDEDPRF